MLWKVGTRGSRWFSRRVRKWSSGAASQRESAGICPGAAALSSVQNISLLLTPIPCHFWVPADFATTHSLEFRRWLTPRCLEPRPARPERRATAWTRIVKQCFRAALLNRQPMLSAEGGSLPASVKQWHLAAFTSCAAASKKPLQRNRLQARRQTQSLSGRAGGFALVALVPSGRYATLLGKTRLPLGCRSGNSIVVPVGIMIAGRPHPAPR